MSIFILITQDVAIHPEWEIEEYVIKSFRLFWFNPKKAPKKVERTATVKMILFSIKANITKGAIFCQVNRVRH